MKKILVRSWMPVVTIILLAFTISACSMINEKRAEGMLEQGLSFQTSGETSSALEAFSEAISLHPEYREAFAARGEYTMSKRIGKKLKQILTKLCSSTRMTANCSI